jgi:hypothetical protein
VKLTADGDTGMPIIPAQSPVACYRITDDATAEVLAEYLVLPNLLCILLPDPDGSGIMVGRSNLMSTQFATMFATEALPGWAEHVTECDCPRHEGRSMAAVDLTTEAL